jgi:hypothetical protein
VPALTSTFLSGGIEQARAVALPVVPNVIAMRDRMEIDAGDVLGPNEKVRFGSDDFLESTIRDQFTQ